MSVNNNWHRFLYTFPGNYSKWYSLVSKWRFTTELVVSSDRQLIIAVVNLDHHCCFIHVRDRHKERDEMAVLWNLHYICSVIIAQIFVYRFMGKFLLKQGFLYTISKNIVNDTHFLVTYTWVLYCYLFYTMTNVQETLTHPWFAIKPISFEADTLQKSVPHQGIEHASKLKE